MRQSEKGSSVRRLGLVVATATVLVLAGCGGDDDENGGNATNQQPPAQDASLQRAAERLEVYLEQNTKNLTSTHAGRGQVVDDVQVADGRLKVFTLLNSELSSEDKTAREVCRRANASGIEEAANAIVVDGGGVLMARC